VSITGSDWNSGTITSPWRTIQKAATTVPAGATVYVRGGTYSGFSVTRSGTSSAWIGFTSYPGESVTISDSSRARVIDVNAARYIRISKLRVTGAPSQWGAGIYVQGGAAFVDILDNVISYNRSFGIKIASSSNVFVSGNDVSKNETGVEVSYGGAGVVITGNNIHDNDRMVVNTVGGDDDRGANAIVLHHTNGPLSISHNRMWNNRATSYDYTYDGGAVEIYAASGATISWNTMWNNENVLETGTDGALCDGNRFVHNVAYGGAKTGPTMGMILRCASNMLVANNTFSDLDRFVFDITASAGSFGGSIAGLRLRNNVAYSGSDKIYSIDSAMPSTVSLDWNLAFHSSGGSIAYVYGHGSTTSLATFRSWTGFDVAGVQADPRFTNRTGADFTLQSTSPAIDRGQVLSGVTDGYLGNGPDLGRHELR
jgi:parallel beta-helix repeat protein